MDQEKLTLSPTTLRRIRQHAANLKGTQAEIIEALILEALLAREFANYYGDRIAD